MRRVWEGAIAIARRDFVATVYKRSFILFLLAPILLMGMSMGMGIYAARSDRAAARETVAIVADAATVRAIETSRRFLVAGTSERVFPAIRAVAPTGDVRAQARQLLADKEAAYSAVLSGTLQRPVLTGPPDAGIAARMQLLVNQARSSAALAQGGVGFRPVTLTQVATQDGAGNLRVMRHAIARVGQFVIFFVTLMLATLLLSNLVEEKSNKVIEVLAAAVPLDSVFVGKLMAMLGMSLVGLIFWGAILALPLLAFPMAGTALASMLPTGGPGVGWAGFFLLLLLYYTMNYMLLGALFLGIGGQASSVREVQTLSMPITFLQMGVLILAITVIGDTTSVMSWVAFIFPLSSPLAMIALAGQSELVWPHLLALAWQLLWVVIIIRIASAMFRKNVLKSGGAEPMFRLRRRRPAQQPAE
jgi:ABC-2 type transport system permease protein